MFKIFLHVESKLRIAKENIQRNVDSKKIDSDLLKNPTVLCNYNKIRHQSAEKLSKEIVMNLLEHLIMLYVRVLIFSLVKDNCELHKTNSKKKKVRSLRTEIKKASSYLEQGLNQRSPEQ